MARILPISRKMNLASLLRLSRSCANSGLPGLLFAIGGLLGSGDAVRKSPELPARSAQNVTEHTNQARRKPTASRAEWAPLGQAYGRDYSTSDVTKVVVLGSGLADGQTGLHGPLHGFSAGVNLLHTIEECGVAAEDKTSVSLPARS